MAAMSRDSSSSSLMGFSVSQPFVGAALQFFPAMGSKELDEMIDAYVPGTASIQDKRTAVSLEFFHHSMQTGETFKFFLVYPTMDFATASPASSNAMQDSGYGSSFNTSPVTSELQWTQAATPSLDSTRRSKARFSSKKGASPSSSRSQMPDFSNIPGMKILTKDGLDVTNSASRGCKTKEQREHAHLMRIIKACDECKRKKIRCDPSHKKRGSAQSRSPDARVTKRVKKSASPPAPVTPVVEAENLTPMSALLDSALPEQLSFDNGFLATQAQATDDWDQFVQYDDSVADVQPLDFDFDFFMDPSNYFSPTTSTSTSVSSTEVPTPSELVTPTGKVSPTGKVYPTGRIHPTGRIQSTGKVYADVGLLDETARVEPTLPYMTPGGVDVGNNYVDFNLYSPSSSSLDEDPSFCKELAASPLPEYGEDLERSGFSRNRGFNFTESQRTTPDTISMSSPMTMASQETRANSRSPTSTWVRLQHSPGYELLSQVGREELSEQHLQYNDVERDNLIIGRAVYTSTGPSPTLESWVPGNVGILPPSPAELPRPRGWRVAIGPSIEQSSQATTTAASDQGSMDSSQLTRHSQRSRTERVSPVAQDLVRTITRHRPGADASLDTGCNYCATEATSGEIDSGSHHQRRWRFNIEDSSEERDIHHRHTNMKHDQSSSHDYTIQEDTRSKATSMAESLTVAAGSLFTQSWQALGYIRCPDHWLTSLRTRSAAMTSPLFGETSQTLKTDQSSAVAVDRTTDSLATKHQDCSQPGPSPLSTMDISVLVTIAIMTTCIAVQLHVMSSSTMDNLLHGLRSMPIFGLLWAAKHFQSANMTDRGQRSTPKLVDTILINEPIATSLADHRSWRAYVGEVLSCNILSSMASYLIPTSSSAQPSSIRCMGKPNFLKQTSCFVKRLMAQPIRSVHTKSRQHPAVALICQTR